MNSNFDLHIQDHKRERDPSSPGQQTEEDIIKEVDEVLVLTDCALIYCRSHFKGKKSGNNFLEMMLKSK